MLYIFCTLNLQVQEHAPQFICPSHHGLDVSTNNSIETASTNTPGGGSYPFVPSNHPPPPPHLLNLQSPLGQTGHEETQVPPPTMWYYRDPHGNIHGPFNDGTMRAWYEAGYFKLGIEMRRECDKVFSQLSKSFSELSPPVVSLFDKHFLLSLLSDYLEWLKERDLICMLGSYNKRDVSGDNFSRQSAVAV